VPKPTKNHSRTGCECGHLKNCQNADEIASTGDNLSVELDSQAGEGGYNNDSEVKRSFNGKTKGTNARSLFTCVLSSCVLAFWTSSQDPRVACEDKDFFTTGRYT